MEFSGFDDNAPLGDETAGRAVIPIWMYFMKEALKDASASDFIAPNDVSFRFRRTHLRETGAARSPDGRLEPFILGKEPKRC